jgi:hypothetical protein
MKPSQIENWTLLIAERVKRGEPLEDSRVEIKARWIPDPNAAARRIGGHVNAAGGEPILWIIGIDEPNNKIVGADKTETANWLQSVQAEFNELAPSVIDLNVPFEGQTLVALLFDTSRAPFAVRNTAHGKSGGGPVSLEVPWREGTRVSSATRSQLIRLLAPFETMPNVDVLSPYLRANQVSPDMLGWYFKMNLYLVSKSQRQIVIPFHKCECTVNITAVKFTQDFDKLFLKPFPEGGHGVSGSLTVRASTVEVIIDSAGMLTLEAYGKSRTLGTNCEYFANVKVVLRQAYDSNPIVIDQNLAPVAPKEGLWGEWNDIFIPISS